MYSDSSQLKKSVLVQLVQTRFPKCHSRKNVADSSESFVLGTVNYRGQSYLQGKTQGPSRYNSKFPELFELCQNLIKSYDPEFSYTTIQVNKNVECAPHIDKNNVGHSVIIALGDYEGGQLVIEGKIFNIKNRFKAFDGRNGHWTLPFTGDRFALVFFTHTFKPPHYSVRNIVIKPDGMYDDGVLVKKYN